jgi:two-component system sensor kinase FixL
VKRPIIGPEGAANQVLGAATDITERKKAEMELQKQRAELAHVARVSLMGELVASLAHELSQPLTAILGNAKAGLNFIEREPADMKEVGAALADIFEANNRATEVIRRIRALVKKDDEVEFETVDLPSVIREVAGLVHGDALMQDIGVRLELDGVRLPVKGNRVQLQQVVLNILLNAFDAIKECPPGERTIRLRAERDANGMGRVAVSDCGAGLKPDELDRIFEPFYTTKREGLGMGLSICRSIVEGHGGRLWAEDNPGRGATFYFTVPIDGNDRRTDRAYRTQTLSPAVGQL